MPKCYKLKFLLILVSGYAPLIVLAQDFSYYAKFLDGLYKVLNPLVAVLIGFALIFFIWQIVRYLGAADNEEQRKEAGKFMLWGLVFIFVMAGVWGLVSLIAGTLGSSTGETGRSYPEVPEIPS